MARYFTDFRENSIGAGVPNGWTNRWSSASFTRAIAADDSGHNASGKRLELSTSATGMRALSWNAVDSDPARATIQIRALVRQHSQSNASANVYGGPFARGSGSSSSENALGAVFGTASSSYREDIRSMQASGGSRSYETGSGASSDPGAWVPTEYYWMTVTISGNSVVTQIASAADPGTILDTATMTGATVSAAGWAGFFVFSPLSNFHVLAFSVGTGGDSAPYGPLAPTSTPTLGTITPSGTGASVAYSNLDIYASGVEYRIDGGGWVNGGAGGSFSISGLVESTEYEIEIRAVNADGAGPASASATFETTAGMVLKGASIALHAGVSPHASLTDLRVLWWDSVAPSASAPDFYSDTESTDGSGLLVLDLDAATALEIGDYGYLLVHKAGTLENEYRDALVFGGAVQVTDIG